VRNALTRGSPRFQSGGERGWYSGKDRRLQSRLPNHGVETWKAFVRDRAAYKTTVSETDYPHAAMVPLWEFFGKEFSAFHAARDTGENSLCSTGLVNCAISIERKRLVEQGPGADSWGLLGSDGGGAPNQRFVASVVD